MSTLAQRWKQSMMDNYGTPPMALVSGHGAVVVDDAGREYLDLLGGSRSTPSVTPIRRWWRR